MTSLKALLRVQCLIVKNRMLQIRKEPALKILFISLTITGFWFGALALFYDGLEFFYRVPLIGPLLVDEGMYLFFSTLFFMLLISSSVINYFTFYRSQEAAFLFSQPLSTRAIYFHCMFQSLFFSSWAVLFLGIPFMIAYAMVKHLTAAFFPFIPLYSIAFILFPSVLTPIIVLGIVSCTVSRSMKLLLAGFVAAAAGMLVIHYLRTVRPDLASGGDLNHFITVFFHHLRFFKHPLFPPYWIATSFIRAGAKRSCDALFYFALYASSTLVILQINWGLANSIFRRLWTTSQSRNTRKHRLSLMKAFIRIGRSVPSLPKAAVAMTVKDMTLFLRDGRQWSQIFVYFGILGIYILNLHNFPLITDSVYWKSIVIFLNLSAISLVLAGFTVRFLFPLMSLEGTMMWFLGPSPLSYRSIIFQKYALYLALILIPSEVLIVATNMILNTQTLLSFLSCAIIAFIVAGLVGLSVGLGSLYPRFGEENPAKIVSGLGGTINFIVALTYVTLVIAAFALPYFAAYVYNAMTPRSFSLTLVASFLIMTLLTVLVGFVPLIAGYRNLGKSDF